MAINQSTGSEKRAGKKRSNDSHSREASVEEGGPSKAAEPGRMQTNEYASGKRPPEQIGERHRRISEAAYQIAQQRDFDGGQQIDDWLQAEREIDNSSNDEQHRDQP